MMRVPMSMATCRTGRGGWGQAFGVFCSTLRHRYQHDQRRSLILGLHYRRLCAAPGVAPRGDGGQLQPASDDQPLETWCPVLHCVASPVGGSSPHPGERVTPQP